jgi:uncharacterized Zn-finger protein
MLQPIETLFIDTPKIACDGDKSSPHPRVFLTVGKQNFVDCPYCGKHFVLREGAHGGNAH